MPFAKPTRHCNMKTIVILRNRPSKTMYYAIDLYAQIWKSNGYEVIDHIGLNSIPPADAIILHVDKTILPSDYALLHERYPIVINGKVSDISRRRFSQLKLSSTDNYKGPAIVKTNANYGGWPEHILHRRNAWKKKIQQHLLQQPPRSNFALNNLESQHDRNKSFLRQFASAGTHSLMSVFQSLRQINQADRWQTTSTLNPRRYPIFEKFEDIPPGVWKNDHLIVERFISDYQDGLFHINYYCFFGDKEISGRLGAPNPIVKFSNCETDSFQPTPNPVRQWRKSLGLDFGRLDYVQQDGEYFLIDANKTEGGGSNNKAYMHEMEFLASGLDAFLDDPPS